VERETRGKRAKKKRMGGETKKMARTKS